MYKVGIIGAGQIASGYDSPLSNDYLTHAHTISELDDFYLEGFYDINQSQMNRAAKKWNTNAYSTAEELVKASDIIVCAVPDDHHYEMLKRIFESDTHLCGVICEKPLALKPDQGAEICALYKSRDILLTVNYTRRFLDGFDEAKRKIKIFGDFVRGNCYYGKGLMHNGSHMINIIDHILGLSDISDVGILESVNDYSEDDLSVSFYLTLCGKARVYFQVIPCNITSAFQFELFFEKGKLCYDSTQERIYVYDIGALKKYTGYTCYQQTSIIETNRSKAMLNLYRCVLNSIEMGFDNRCSGEDALRTLAICDEITKKRKDWING